MGKAFLIIWFPIINSLVGFSQSNSKPVEKQNKFEELYDQLTFNILTRQADSSVYWFIKKYYPYLTVPSRVTGWTSYPPGPVREYELTVHSIKFRKHPYFNADFRMGRLDLESQEEKEGTPTLSGVYVWFMFDSYAKALKAFVKLCGMFQKVSTNHKVTKVKGRIVAEYVHSQEVFPDDVYIVMSEDEIYPDRYKILFGIGAYKDNKELNRY
jgi:hypothetical protein